jgi:hypothetical protein
MRSKRTRRLVLRQAAINDTGVAGDEAGGDEDDERVHFSFPLLFSQTSTGASCAGFV